MTRQYTNCLFLSIGKVNKKKIHICKILPNQSMYRRVRKSPELEVRLPGFASDVYHLLSL